jgi:hypothetical protein
LCRYANLPDPCWRSNSFLNKVPSLTAYKLTKAHLNFNVAPPKGKSRDDEALNPGKKRSAKEKGGDLEVETQKKQKKQKNAVDNSIPNIATTESSSIGDRNELNVMCFSIPESRKNIYELRSRKTNSK